MRQRAPHGMANCASAGVPRWRHMLRALHVLLLMACCTNPNAAAAVPPANTQADAAIAFLEARVARDAEDIVALNMLGDRYLQRLSAGSGDQDLVRAGDAARRSLAAVPAVLNPAALALQVRVLQASHRFAAAAEGARKLLELTPSRSEPYLLLGDALLEYGKLDEASAAFMKAHGIDGDSIDLHIRFARLALARGQRDVALHHLRLALRGAQALTLPAPDLVAWCHVQLGRYWFAAGRLEDAEAEYRAAARATPDSLLVRDQLAELAAARGDYTKAIADYRALVAASPRPEFRQALGDVYAFANDPAAARRWHREAEAGYLASVRAGRVHYYHHLAGFYSDSQRDGAAAVTYAQKDLALRNSIAAQDALAWAYYVADRIDDAAAVSAKLPIAQVADAHVLYHAGMIASRHGNVAVGAQLLRRAVQQNPRYNGFHVHR